MTLTRAINVHVGSSRDDKPLGEPVGSTFEELDTTDKYTWDGSRWFIDRTNDEVLSVLKDIKALLRQVDQRLENAGMDC